MAIETAPVEHVWQSTEFIAAIVGGLISFVLQIIALIAAKRQRDSDRSDARKALGYPLLIKVIQTHTTYNTIKKYFDESFDHAANQGFDGRPWQIVKPMTHVPPDVVFAADELALLLSLKDDEVTNLVFGRDDTHNSFLGAVRLFNDLKLQLRDKLPSRGVGELVEVVMPQEDAELVMPRMYELDALIGDIRSWADKERKEIDAVLSRLHRTLKEGLGLSVGISPKLVVRKT